MSSFSSLECTSIFYFSFPSFLGGKGEIYPTINNNIPTAINEIVLKSLSWSCKSTTKSFRTTKPKREAPSIHKILRCFLVAKKVKLSPKSVQKILSVVCV